MARYKDIKIEKHDIVCDLSDLAQPLMAYEDISDCLLYTSDAADEE